LASYSSESVCTKGDIEHLSYFVLIVTAAGKVSSHYKYRTTSTSVQPHAKHADQSKRLTKYSNCVKFSKNVF
jgi:hypothetical protein